MKDSTDNREGKQECLEIINKQDFFWENSHEGFWFGLASLSSFLKSGMIESAMFFPPKILIFLSYVYVRAAV